MKAGVDKEKLIQSTLVLGDRAFKELFPFMPKEWLDMDLTAGQFRTLLMLYSRGPSRMTEVAATLGVSMATATGVIDRMVERELVVRQDNPKDRRIVLCHIAPAGERLISSLWRAWMRRGEQMLRVLDRPKLMAVRGMLEALMEAGENTRGMW